MRYVKQVSESSTTTIPSEYAFTAINPDDSAVVDTPTNGEESVEVPIIDFSLLTSCASPEQRSQAVRDLGKACLEWGFFSVINHGIPEELLEEMMNLCTSFFDLSEDEKLEYSAKHVLDGICCGTSFNASLEKVFFWRDFLKMIVHPEFNSPSKPPGFCETLYEYSKRKREVVTELLKGISESLGLEESYIHKALDMESCFQLFVANLYPPCSQPELAMGMPPHSDFGVLTLLIQNTGGGLQVKHKEKWVKVDAPPNSIMVNIGDHIEILSNGIYKSCLHRAVVNNKTTRISVGIAHGPSMDAVVEPAQELVVKMNNRPAYHGMKFKEYVELQQSNQLDGKSCLDRVRVSNI